MSKLHVTDSEIIEAAINSNSAASAAAKLNIQYTTFKKHATRLGVFKTNKSGKGLSKIKKDGFGKIPLIDIFAGKQPQYQSNKLRKRLFEEGYKKRKCERCEITDWMGAQLSFECEHINGNRNDHRLENLMILCPNCHSQTNTYRGKNIKK